MPEVNGKENQEKSYIKKYQKHIDCSYGYKLVCIYDKINNPVRTCLDGDTF